VVGPWRERAVHNVERLRARRRGELSTTAGVPAERANRCGMATDCAALGRCLVPTLLALGLIRLSRTQADAGPSALVLNELYARAQGLWLKTNSGAFLAVQRARIGRYCKVIAVAAGGPPANRR
jgi:hypothetical protein